jgi:hypothetical protein
MAFTIHMVFRYMEFADIPQGVKKFQEKIFTYTVILLNTIISVLDI